MTSICGWRCTACGPLDRTSLSLYRPAMFNTHSRRLDPHCVTCGASALYHPGPAGAPAKEGTAGGQILIVNGTCASGKSTISYLLSEHYGFIQVDGDWILHRAKQENPQTHSDEIHADLAALAASLADLGQPVVLAHVIPPEYLDIYERILGGKGIEVRTVILMPRRSILLARNETRKCWPTTTPEYWVHKFYDEFLVASRDLECYFYDNTDETEIETASALSQLFGEP